jgi:SPP1 gp7 family putative phage head morphogenesis protein
MARPSRRPRPRRPRRKPPIPRNAARRARSPRPPRAVEHYYVLALRRVAARFARAVARILYPRLKDFAVDTDERKDAVDDDDDTPDADELVSKVRKAADRVVDEEEFTSFSHTAADRAVQHNKREFRRLGLPNPKREPVMGRLINGWVRENIERVKGLLEDQINKIHRILTDGIGHRHETLAKMIAEQVEDITASKAEQIARISVLRLNAQINRSRQSAAGIERYVWSTSNDERVRPEHVALEGKIFTWESGGDPDEGHPGEAPNCRCVAFPILPELEDGGELQEAAE